MALAVDLGRTRYAVDVHLLRVSQLFSVLHGPALRELAGVAYAEVYRGGSEIRETEHFRETVFIVADGRVRSYLLSPAGNTITLNILRRGEVFMAPWALSPRADVKAPTSSAGYKHESYFQAITRTTVYRVPNHYVQRLVGREPRLAAALLELYGMWSSLILDQLEILAFLRVPQRLARTLARLAAANDRHLVLETHQELAWLIGATRETVTKELNRLRQMALIEYELHHNGIYVRDMERLDTI